MEAGQVRRRQSSRPAAHHPGSVCTRSRASPQTQGCGMSRELCDAEFSENAVTDRPNTVPGGKHRDDPPPQIQQAQKPVEGAQFLPNVAKPTERREHKLTRLAFTVSRLTDYCSEKELVKQTGHAVQDWPLVMLKELFDNAL